MGEMCSVLDPHQTLFTQGAFPVNDMPCPFSAGRLDSAIRDIKNRSGIGDISNSISDIGNSFSDIGNSFSDISNSLSDSSNSIFDICNSISDIANPISDICNSENCHK